jgi:hypothetical protein
MAGKNRTVIEKSEGMFVFKDNARGEFTGDDFAEETG